MTIKGAAPDISHRCSAASRVGARPYLYPAIDARRKIAQACGFYRRITSDHAKRRTPLLPSASRLGSVSQSMGWKAFLCFAVFAGGAGANAEDAVKIGEVNPISGAIGGYGTTCHNGIKLAIDQANARWGCAWETGRLY